MSLLGPEQNALRLLFENSPDAAWLFDVQSFLFVDCNAAAVAMMGAPEKDQLLQRPPTDFAPEFQPDGCPSADRAVELFNEVQAKGSARFEWLARRLDGHLFPVEVVSTRVRHLERELHFVVSRDITERKRTEEALRASEQRLRQICENRGVAMVQIQEENQQLEMRVRERTIELVQTNEQLKAEVRQRRRKEKIQQAIYHISQSVLTTNDLPSLYQEVHRSVQSLMSAKNFYLALRERGDDLFHFPYFVDEIDPPPQPMTITTGLTGYVLRTGKPLLVNRHTKIEKTPDGIAVLPDDPQSGYWESGTPAAVWLGAPLTVEGETMGVMAVQDYQNETAYAEEEKQLFAFVAEQTALAIHRKRAEQALRDSEQKHRALFETSSQGVMLHDEEQFLEVNQATVRILGYNSAEELLGKHPAETSAPIQPNGETAAVLARRYIKDCLEQGHARFEWMAVNPKGEEVPIEVILTRIPMGGRQIIQAVINDISDRKRAEAELLRALAREKELSQLKTNFVSTVSHEFRTPLGIIMSSSQILADYFDSLTAEERREHLASIAKNTRRMASLMEEVLLLSRVDSGKMAFEPRPVDLRTLFRRLTDEVLSTTDRQCPIQLTLSDASAVGYADERLLEHIFTNLLSNAVKYSAPGSPVQMAVSRDGDDLVCEVRDRGIGIPEADRSWLFQAFHRARNVGDRPGTGLGLTIVKRCIELHGGTIRVDSVVGEGTMVTARLPVFATARPDTN